MGVQDDFDLWERELREWAETWGPDPPWSALGLKDADDPAPRPADTGLPQLPEGRDPGRPGAPEEGPLGPADPGAREEPTGKPTDPKPTADPAGLQAPEETPPGEPGTKAQDPRGPADSDEPRMGPRQPNGTAGAGGTTGSWRWQAKPGGRAEDADTPKTPDDDADDRRPGGRAMLAVAAVIAVGYVLSIFLGRALLGFAGLLLAGLILLLWRIGF